MFFTCSCGAFSLCHVDLRLANLKSATLNFECFVEVGGPLTEMVKDVVESAGKAGEGSSDQSLLRCT